jgi:predicted glycosyltransferase
MRFVSWKAMHDVGKKGFDDKSKIEAVRKLEEIMPVYITSEGKLPTELEKNKVKVSPEKMHDILFYAHTFMGDSQTMTTEAALLGTPAVRCNTFVGENDMGNFKELESEYGVIFNYVNPNEAIHKAVELCNTPDIKQEWEKRREKILGNKIDVTAFMVWFVENYPQSFSEMKKHPIVQYTCPPILGCDAV